MASPIILYLLALIGIVALSNSILNIIRGLSTRTWIKTTAKINVSGIRRTTATSRESSENGFLPFYVPDIKYTYTVNETRLQGNKIKISEGWGSFSAAKFQKILAQFPQGASVPIWYNPKKPGEAVLMQGMHRADFETTLLIMAYIAVCISIAASF